MDYFLANPSLHASHAVVCEVERGGGGVAQPVLRGLQVEPGDGAARRRDVEEGGVGAPAHVAQQRGGRAGEGQEVARKRQLNHGLIHFNIKEILM